MIDEVQALELQKSQQWDQLFELISSWPEGEVRSWYLGNWYLLAQQQYAKAVEAYTPLLALAPPRVEVLLQLGRALHGADRVADALVCYLQAIKLCRRRGDPRLKTACVGYGLACLELGLYRHWLDCLERLDPQAELQQLPFLAALAHLALGNWSTGWRLYEQRDVWFGLAPAFQDLPVWSEGSRPPQTPLLISSDMGLGDFIFFLRFVPLLRRQGQAVVARVAPDLRRLALASGMFDAVLDVLADPCPAQLPWQLRSTSIAQFLGGVSPASAPTAGYLSVAEAEAEPEPSPLPASAPSPRPLVALNWAGNRRAEGPRSTVRARSLSLQQLESVPALRRVDLLSVQMGEEEAKQASSLLNPQHPLQRRLDQAEPDIWTTASCLTHCDLLITNDTALAHLGGALGMPTWVLLKRHPSWQWGDAGPSPWYSTVRCFRQRRAFVWDDVLQDLDQALDAWIASAGPP